MRRPAQIDWAALWWPAKGSERGNVAYGTQAMLARCNLQCVSVACVAAALERAQLAIFHKRK